MSRALLILLFLSLCMSLSAQEPELVLPIGHTKKVTKALTTADGTILITCSEDGTAKIWNYRTGKLMHNLALHTRSLVDMALSSDESFVVLASADGSYSKWSVASGKLLFQSQRKAGIEKCFLLPGDSTILLQKAYVLVIGGFNEEWEDIEFDEVNGYSASGVKKRVALSPDGKTIAVHQEGEWLRFFSSEDGAYINSVDRIQIDSTRYYDMRKLVPSGLVFINNQEVVWQSEWKFMAGFRVDSARRTFLYDRGTNELAASADGRYLAFFNARQDSVVVWDYAIKQPLYTAPSHNSFELVGFLPGDSSLMLYSYLKGTMVELSMDGAQLRRTTQGKEALLAGFSKDKTQVLVGDWDGGLQALSRSSGSVTNDFTGKVALVQSACMSPEGRYIFELKKDYVNYWDVKAAKSTRFPELGKEVAKAVLPLRTPGRVIVHYPKSFGLFDLAAGRFVYTRKGEPDFTQLKLLRGDSLLVTLADDKVLQQWEIATGRLVREFVFPSRAYDLTVSDDHSLVAHRTNEVNKDSVFVWNLATGKRWAAIERPGTFWEVSWGLAHSTATYSPAMRFSADNKYVLFSSREEGVLAVAELPVMEVYDQDTFYTGSAIVHEEGFQYFTESVPVAVRANSFVLVSRQSHGGGTDAIEAFDFKESWQEGFSLEYQEFQRIVYLDTMENRLYTATIKEFLIWDLNTKKLQTKYTLPSGMRVVAYSEQTHQVLLQSSDRVGVMPLDGKKPVFYLSTFNSGDYIAFRSDRYYMSSPDAVRWASWKVGDRLYDFDQWDLQYNRPDKLIEAMDGPQNAMTAAYYSAYQKRLQRSGVSEKMFRPTYSIPSTLILNDIKDGMAADSSLFLLRVKCTNTDRKAKVSALMVSVNDNPVFGKKGLLVKDKKSREHSFTIPISLSAGANNIKVSCIDERGAESLRQQLQVRYTPPQAVKKKLHFVGIGINRFKDDRHNLQWSVKDIRDLALNLKEKHGDALVIDTLFDEAVTPGNITALKGRLLQTTVNDKVLLSYSGHGLLSKAYDYYLSTYAVNFLAPEEGGLPYEALEDLLDGIPARQKLVLIDACHSGEVDKEELRKIGKVNSEVATEGVKGATPLVLNSQKTLGLSSSFELMQELFVNVGRSTGATVISAAGGTQFALERGDLKNGVFTYSILEFMKQHSAATVSELKQYVNLRVPELTKGAQVPATRGASVAAEWRVW